MAQALFLPGATQRRIWLPGQDSNLQPCGYKRPFLSEGLGLSHHPGGCRALRPFASAKKATAFRP